MSERLLSLGLDVGTTSTQMVFSELAVENRAGSFAVPELEICRRQVLYKSPIHFTPLLAGDLVDAAALRQIVDREYEHAGLEKQAVDTGAIIITGETSRKENARAVLRELSGYAGDFVVATAGPDMESVLAAKGAGAVDYSHRTGKRVLHMDIGGGTSNLALIEDGMITATGCLNVGGRLVKIEKDGKVTYISPVLTGIFSGNVGDIVKEEDMHTLAGTLVQALEMAAGLREPGELLETLTTRETADRRLYSRVREGERAVISFSGGVADCIERNHPWLQFGDIGPLLGRAIRESGLCRGEYILGEETIRATVIGAGCHSAQLSGSTVFHRNVPFPLKNLPVIRLEDPETLGKVLQIQEGPAVLAMTGPENAGYADIKVLAEAIIQGFGDGPVLVCLERDMAKALGQALALCLPADREILCIDRVRLKEGDYLDVAAPVGPALPVVVKTLVMGR